MFQPNYYYKDNNYHVDIVMLGEIILDSLSHNSLEELINTYIQFEEEFYGFEFTNDIKQLRIKNVELGFKFDIDKDKDIYNEIIEVNGSLQKLYEKSGFEKIRTEVRESYLYNEQKELESYGGELDG